MQRLAIREEILKKQEELKEEQRRRKELWKSQNDGSSNDNIDSSPTKNDSLPATTKPVIGMGRKKRRSMSSRRRRSNSEGSDSSLSESSDLVVLEFLCGKTLQQFYKGEVIGEFQFETFKFKGTILSMHMVSRLLKRHMLK